MDEKNKGERAKAVVSLLPKKNCGKCGFENCGRFAVTVVEGKTSSFGCHENHSVGYEISRVLGIEVPENVNLPKDYSASSQNNISINNINKRGRSHGHGWGRSHIHHASGQRRHNSGHGKARRNHRQRGRYHPKRHGLSIRKMLADFLRLISQ